MTGGLQTRRAITVYVRMAQPHDTGGWAKKRPRERVNALNRGLIHLTQQEDW